MAGGNSRRANSLQASSWLSPSFTGLCLSILHSLKRPGFEVMCVGGWDRVGRRRVVRQVADMFEGGGDVFSTAATTTTTLNNNSGSDPRPVFAHVLRLAKQEDETEMGRRIQEMLQSVRNDEGQPFENWWEPLVLPEHATLVVIEQDFGRTINRDVVFGPSFFVWPNCRLKVVVPLGPNEPSPHVIVPSARSEFGSSVSCDFSALEAEEAWDLLQHEADEMADELRREQQQLLFTGDAIMECFLYATLFETHPTPFHTHWWCEGLLPLSTMTASAATNRITKASSDMFNPLLNKFRQRSMLTDNHTLPSELQSKVRTIATTFCQSPPSRINKKGRYLVAINEGLKELPQGMEGLWDQQGITRVSLQANQIERLQCPPVTILLSSRQGTSSNIISPTKCENLSTLILSGNPLRVGIQDDFFQAGMIMPNLHVLDLSFSEGLHILPTSLTCLTNLRLLDIKMCPSLHTISPFLDEGLPNLEILDIRSCPLLGMTTASFRQVPNLRLLLTDYKSFLNLEVLDLSGTKIEYLPDLPDTNMSKVFTRLDIINTKHLYVVQWPNFTRMPTTISWDQCGCCTITPHSTDRTGRLQICVQEVSIFKSLSKDHALWSQPFQEFRIHVHPCTKHPQQHPQSIRRPIVDDQYSHYPHDHHYHLHREYPLSPYKNLNIPEIKRGQKDHQYCCNYDPPSHWRHLHICGVSTPFTSPMEGVLPNMHSLQLCNHDSVKLLLVVHPMQLRTCKVVKCPSMETVFYGKPTSELAHLETINLFHLIRLETLYRGSFGPTGSFACLRSVYVDNCPRMITIFSSTPHNILLPQLKELVIKSCGTLSEVFGRGAVGSTVAPTLSYLYLWDLPELRYVCDGCLPSLRTLKLRGCTKLRALPLPPVDSEGKSFKLNITAEQNWWENLNETNKKHIIFKPWSPWTSRS